MCTGWLATGCCANNVCECDDARQDAIVLRFSADTLRAAGQGFRAMDLDTVVVLRYPLPAVANSKFETVTLYRRNTLATDSTFVLNNNTPFAQVGSTKLHHYRYVVRYLAHPRGGNGMPIKRGVPTTVLTIDKVLLKGSFDGNGCCTCYTNTQKALYRDSTNTLVSLEGNNQVLISKP